MKRFKQFVHTTRDVFKLYWEIAPFLTLGVLITQVISQLQGITTAYLVSLFIDKTLNAISTTKNVDQVLPTIIALGSSFLIFDLVGILNNYFSNILTTIDISKIRLKQIDFMIKLGIPQMENPDLTNKSTRFNEVYGSMNQHLSLLVDIISTVVSTFAYGIVVFSFAPIIVFAVLTLFIIKFINNGRFIYKIWKLYLEKTEERRNAWSSVSYLGDPANLKEIILTNGVNLLRRKFVEFTDWYNNSYTKLRKTWAFFESLQVFSDASVFTWGMFLLVKKAIEGTVSIGGVTFYLRSLGSFTDQLSSLSYRISRAIDSGNRLNDALEIFELYKPEADGVKMLSSKNEPPLIKAENISFKYPNGKNSVIKSLNIVINPGEKIAIVGENGAGKTTLVKLLTRIYRPQIGKISIDRIELNSVKKDSLYSKFGVLFQDFNTYGNLTVSENIQMGKISKDVDTNLIEKSLIKADAMGFVEKYPKKLDQILSERYKGGIRPSGGQWQKIAIARFFYRNAPILILDEPTASIDAVSEAEIFNNIYKFMTGKTVIIISHRFSTVRNADRILVLDKGRIIEEGSHEELLKLDGKYAHMYGLQAKGYV
ncbi:MAG TPA: ABC transporter ATP-binding protein [Patescibacteria group bacterium]|nr:ABC transporter ATP-binding protein [Patescibacteria group bacterium]